MKKDARSLSHEVLESYRIKAISLYKQQVDMKVIIKTFSVHRGTISRWIKIFRDKGIKALRSTKAQGREKKITKDVMKDLIRIIKKPASKEGYDTDLWTGPKIRHLLKHHFGIEYHLNHMPRLLRSLGLKLLFPERRALEQDDKLVRKWKRIILPKIIKDAKNKGAMLYYADEALVSLIPNIKKSWTVKGYKQIAKVSGKRGQHTGITAAITQSGKLCFELTNDKERFNSHTFIRFIKKLKKENQKKKLVLIVDGASCHKSKLVKAFTEKNKNWLKIEILPAYSPELNPTEKTWNVLKNQKMSGVQVQNKEALRDLTHKKMCEIKKNKAKISSFF